MRYSPCSPNRDILCNPIHRPLQCSGIVAVGEGSGGIVFFYTGFCTPTLFFETLYQYFCRYPFKFLIICAAVAYKCFIPSHYLIIIHIGENNAGIGIFLVVAIAKMHIKKTLRPVGLIIFFAVPRSRTFVTE